MANVEPASERSDTVFRLASAGLTPDRRSQAANVSVDTSFDRPGFFYDDGTDGDFVAMRDVDRKLIHSAQLTIVVSAINEAIRVITKRCEDAGGYVAERQDALLTLRVPADRYTELLSATRALGRVVRDLRQTSDVTDEYVDLELRLQNAEKSRERLLALLDKATVIEDIIKIEEALQRLTTDIESMKGKLQLLSHQVGFSRVEVYLHALEEGGEWTRGQKSRFPWIRRLGIEQDLTRF